MVAATALRDRLIALIEPVLAVLGYELVDIEWVAERGGGVVRVYIDLLPGSAGHVSVEDCERVSREVSALLDVDDPVPGAYSLEVSSPGFDRVLRVPQHYARFVGCRVRVELNAARDGRRRYTGTLSAVNAQGIELEVEQLPVTVRFEDIAKARLVA
jgi:ribosome maturation factor RimP